MINDIAKDLKEKLGTPIYILDFSKVKDNITELKNNISYPDLKIHYAMFCNHNEDLLGLIKELNLGVLALHEKDIRRAIDIGFDKEDIQLTGGTFNKACLENLIKYDVDINLDSLKQLELFGSINPNSSVGIRIKISTDNAVGRGEGVDILDIRKIIEIAKSYSIKIKGLQTYIGTNTLDEQKYINTAKILISISEMFPELEYINLGGGFGIPYSSKDKTFSWPTFGSEISRLFSQIKRGRENSIQLKIEPGRSIVGNAGYFLTRVIEKRGDNTLIVDAPYTNFARPFVYHINHKIECLNKNGSDSKIFKIRGCTINSNDYLSHPDFNGDCAKLPRDIDEGDLLMFSDVGAYSPAMQMDFLGYEKARIAIVHNDTLI